MCEGAIQEPGQERFVREATIRRAYLPSPNLGRRAAPPFVSLVPKDGLELGVVSCQVPELARAVSALLTRSLEDAKDTYGGHLPAAVVERVQRTIISPFGVANIWGLTGHRFILSRPAGAGWREIVASALVAADHDTVFFFTGRYNNLRQSTLRDTVDLAQPAGANPWERWFDQFAFPPLERFKPYGYHQLANFVVAREHRGRGYAKALLDGIARHYAAVSLASRGGDPEHGQALLAGRGFWQVGDPPWLPKMAALGFFRRAGAESFFVERPWSPLPPLRKAGRKVGNLEYTHALGLPELYERFTPFPSDEHLLGRIPEVVRLSQDPQAKLQYFQVMRDFP